MKKTLFILALLLLIPAFAQATEYTGTVSVPKFSLSGTLASAADTTFTVNLNNGSQTGTAIFTQTVADASPTTPSLASGTLTGGGSTTFTLTVNTTGTLAVPWTGYISYGDGETTGPITISAVAAAETPPDYSVSGSDIRDKTSGLALTSILWESDNAGSSTGTVTLPMGLIRSARFFNTIAPSEDYDITLKDSSGLDVFVAGGADLTSASTTTINPVLNSTYPVAVFGAYQFLVTNAGADRSGRVEILIGN